MSSDPHSLIGNAKRRIEHATDAIRSMSQDLADEVTPRRKWVKRVSVMTRDAPIHALAIAFLLGVIIGRR